MDSLLLIFIVLVVLAISYYVYSKSPSDDSSKSAPVEGEAAPVVVGDDMSEA